MNLEPHEWRERSLWLWGIGVWKARIMTTINKALISVDQDVKIYGVTNKASKLTKDAEREWWGLKCCFVIKPTGILS